MSDFLFALALLTTAVVASKILDEPRNEIDWDAALVKLLASP